MSDDDRRNPDALLASIKREEAQRKRGRLKVFLGMCPGVGKTFAMLEAGHRELKAGRDVVVGHVETHQRQETDSLVSGLPQVPHLELEYRGMRLHELNLDELLARHPQIALVDELAHTNAPGSRHPKRWQDVQELLSSGIDVFTTLNVQHVDSRADTVRQITGAEIRETVPDSLLDEAIMELVDIPPAELLRRLQEGKVYVPDRAAAAAQNFFREANLTALREIALRLVAEHVGVDTRELRQALPGAGPWKTSVRLMVAVGPSPLSASLVRWTRRLADALQAPWLAVSVEGSNPVHEDQQARLAANLNLARQLGGEVVTTVDEDMVRGLLRSAREHDVTQIVFGKPGPGRWLGVRQRRHVLRRLVESSGDIDVLVVRADKPETPPPAKAALLNLESQSGQYLAAFASCAAVTLVAWVLQRWIGYQTVALIFLSAVVLLAMFVGRGPIFFAATLTALSWNFLFVPPLFTLWITGFHDSMMFALYFLVALATGQLTARQRLQQAADREREKRTAALYRLTRELAAATDYAQVLGAAIKEVGAAFDADVALMLSGSNENQELVRYFAAPWLLDDKEEAVAAWAFHHDQPAGRFTDTLPQAAGLHCPLSAGGKSSGVIALRFRSSQPLSIQQRSLLESFVRQIALVIDRQRLKEGEFGAQLIAKSEQLSRTLLNSVSHELRTPISAIISATSALAGAGPLNEAQRGLSEEIDLASKRLNRVVQNLLGAARLQSGHIAPKMDWCDVAEWVEISVQALGRQLEGRTILRDIPRDLPLIRGDLVLLEQALNNLLLNASTYTPPGTPIEIGAARDTKHLILTVADHGPGLSTHELDRVFDLFHRGPDAAAGGTGLGLAIVKGFVEAQGGQVTASNRPGGGAQFSISLPLAEPPPPPAQQT
ncbi:MAG: sensor histidine kinase KdpD [Verrucomicrobiales bacterium]|nr:sensor histidine kinase KdpD [Verrucomicrobiales bacterium]